MWRLWGSLFKDSLGIVLRNSFLGVEFRVSFRVRGLECRGEKSLSPKPKARLGFSLQVLGCRPWSLGLKVCGGFRICCFGFKEDLEGRSP